MPKLLINAGTRHALEVELKPGANLLGRGEASDFIFEDASVSSRHAEIYVNGSSVKIKDLGSTNGTFIDHEAIAEAVLKSGQVLQLGGVEMIYQEEPRARVLPPPLAQVLATLSSEPSLQPRPETATTAPPTVPAAVEVEAILVQEPPKPAAETAALETGGTPDPLSLPRRGLARGIDFYRRRPAVTESRPAPKPVSAEAPRVSPIAPQARPGQLLGAFSYPLRAGTGLVVISMAICLAGADFVAGFFPVAAVIIEFLVAGYVLAFLQKVVRDAAQGSDSETPLPDLANPREELVAPAMQTLGTVLVCFGPAIALGLLSQTRGAGFASFGIFPTALLGCLYFPMAFLMVTMFDTLAAINPAQVMPALLKVPGPCMSVGAILGLALVVLCVGNAALTAVVAIPILPQVLCRLLGLYLLTVASRKLGLVYFTNRRRLAWFSRGTAVESC